MSKNDDDVPEESAYWLRGGQPSKPTDLNASDAAGRPRLGYKHYSQEFAFTANVPLQDYRRNLDEFLRNAHGFDSSDFQSVDADMHSAWLHRERLDLPEAASRMHELFMQDVAAWAGSGEAQRPPLDEYVNATGRGPRAGMAKRHLEWGRGLIEQLCMAADCKSDLRETSRRCIAEIPGTWERKRTMDAVFVLLDTQWGVAMLGSVDASVPIEICRVAAETYAKNLKAMKPLPSQGGPS